MSICSCPAGRRWPGSSIRSPDTDYSGSTCLEADLRLDAHDSFRHGSMEVGWAIGAGFELPLAVRWALRFDGFVSGLRQRDLSREPVRQQFMRARRRHDALPLYRQETGWAWSAWGSSIGSANRVCWASADVAPCTACKFARKLEMVFR